MAFSFPDLLDVVVEKARFPETTVIILHLRFPIPLPDYPPFGSLALLLLFRSKPWTCPKSTTSFCCRLVALLSH